MEISDHLMQGFLNCNQKVYLLMTGEAGDKSDYDVLQDELNIEYFRKALANLKDGKRIENIFSEPSATFDYLRRGVDLIAGTRITHNDLSAYFDILEKIYGNSALGPFHYSPIIFCNNEKLSKKTKILLAFRSLVIGRLQNRNPEYGRIIYGNSFKTIKINIKSYADEVIRLIEKLKGIANFPPTLILNQHCQFCGFEQKCWEKAIKEDSLSLLRQIKPKEIIKKNRKGIFTLLQLSYTFRPRRRRKKPDGYKRPHSIALRALAIREKKIYVHDTPSIPNKMVDMYFDVEGLDDEPFAYLLGLVVVNNGQIEKYSLWANTPQEEIDIFLSFLNIISAYNDYTLYHYGRYELTFLRRMRKKLESQAKTIDKIITNSFNLLSVFFSHVYVPTYTNGLKDIGKFLGYHWTNANASGVQSIIWRKRWERTGLADYKNELLQYNLEDCEALITLKNLIEYIIVNEDSKNENCPDNLVFLNNLRKGSPFKFLVGEFALPEIKILNNYAQFDYQKEKVHIRTNKYFKKYYSKKRTIKKRQYYKPNTSIVPLQKDICPICNTPSKIKVRPLSKIIVDLKFSKTGVKRWVIQINSYFYRCRKCKKSFIPEWYKKIEKKYGHSLMAWVIYQHIVNDRSFRQIADDCKELFSLHLAKSNSHIFKTYISEYYRETFENISIKLLNSPVLYVDETPIVMKYESGYAWVITNTEEVISFYKPTREGDSIKQYLEQFKGILVSDFYTAYDALDCPQQKCLIHLIRDFNDDLLKNPFDDEFKTLAKQFTALLQEIIATIDKHGLKKRYLNKHNKSVRTFFRNILSNSYSSETARQYQNRIFKNQEKLFLFLNHDSVSWNNNAAEHAIKMLATHKNKKLDFFRESRIEDYLKIMSVYQTCKSKGISFLKFMLSKQKDLDNFCNNFMRKRNITGICG